jgi:hypothetical protein
MSTPTPWDHLVRAHRHAERGLAGWGGFALTALLVGIGLVLLWIAFRGSSRMKAATAVWVMFP